MLGEVRKILQQIYVIRRDKADKARDSGEFFFNMKPSNPKHRGVFGLRLKTARLSVGIPQDKLGVKIGLDEFVASARISRYESGIHQPNFDVARKLALVLNVPLAYFYCEDDRMAQLLLLVASFTETQWANLLTAITSNPDSFS